MIKGKLLHPEILHTLASSGHGSKILIADGNYPFITRSPQTAKKVFLNLSPGIVKVTDVLAVLVDVIPIELAEVMIPPETEERPNIYKEIEQILPKNTTMKEHSRIEFYAAVEKPETSLVIATGEQRRFANLLLTIGVIKLSS